MGASLLALAKSIYYLINVWRIVHIIKVTMNAIITFRFVASVLYSLEPLHSVWIYASVVCCGSILSLVKNRFVLF